MCCFCICLLSSTSLYAQNDKLIGVFQGLFQDILGDDTGEGGALQTVQQFDSDGNIIGDHAEHFVDASKLGYRYADTCPGQPYSGECIIFSLEFNFRWGNL